MTNSARFTPEEMTIAKNTDLPILLESLGYHITRKGRYHSTKKMDSLRIKDRRTWFRYSEQVGGDAISFLQHFHGMEFADAVRHLLAFNGYSRDAPVLNARPTPPALSADTGAVEFALPERNPEHRHVYAYLRKRGIADQVIDSFLDARLLYEDAPYHNCVFVDRNASSVPVFANKRGTYDQGERGFKGDVPGSDKSVAFRLPCDPRLNTVHVFESPIDCMSYMTLHRELRSNAIALCCLHDGALETYLRENPHIKAVILCLDTDQWGRKAAAQIIEKYTSLGRNTWIYIDEIYLLFQHEYSANFLFTLWKRVRKYGAFATGLTQNVDDLLQSHTARTMLANSEFLVMLNQASTDRIELAKLLNISDNQLSYITNVDAGRRLLKCGSTLVPFMDNFPRDTHLYSLLTTKLSEVSHTG